MVEFEERVDITMNGERRTPNAERRTPNEIRRQRKLFWSTISQTVSVLVSDSARLSASEIVVDLLAGCLACPNRIIGMAKLAIHLSWCAVLQLHFPNDKVKPADI